MSAEQCCMLTAQAASRVKDRRIMEREAWKNEMLF